MATRVVAVLLVLLVALCASEFTTVYVIDDFEVDTEPLGLLLTTSELPPQTSSTSTQIPGVLGGERDLILTAEDGGPGNLMTCVVQDGAWTSASPQQAAGFSSIQYDGLQYGGVTNLYNGLECFDVTVGGTAGGFLIQAQSTTSTDFKFTIHGFYEGIASVEEQVTTNEQTYYYIPFDTFMGEVDFTCVGSIEVTATIPTYSQFVVDTFVLGTYTPDQPSVTPSSTATPSRTPTKSPLISDFMAGPTESPTPSPTPMVRHDECVNSDDCLYLSNECTVASCDQHSCVTQPFIGSSGCCADASDCTLPHEGTVTCVENFCVYEEVDDYDSSEYVFNEVSSKSGDDDGSMSGAIIGVIVGSVVLCCIVTGIVCFVGIVKLRSKKNTNSTSVYDAMIGDM